MAVDERRKVSWGAVIGGIAAAAVFGFLVAIFSTIFGMAAFAQWNSKAAGILVAVGMPSLPIALLYAALRRSSPDFARGLLIGLCLVVIWAGICGGTIIGSMPGN